jgi:hypothetical protein
MRALASLGNGDQGHAELMVAALAVKAYPEAKRELVAAGYDPQRVEAMPVGQVIAIQTARITDYAYQEAFKWLSLPYWQAAEQMAAVDEKLIQEGVIGPAARLSRGALPVASLLLPATAAARVAQVRIERNRAALQTLEAVRMHAAQTGALPESLDELKPPAPRNPSTGQPFSYQRTANGAVLEASAIGDLPPRASALRYEITLRKPSN